MTRSTMDRIVPRLTCNFLPRFTRRIAKITKKRNITSWYEYHALRRECSRLSQRVHQPVLVRIGLSIENLPGFEQASAQQVQPQGATFVGPQRPFRPSSTEPGEALEYLDRVRGRSPHERDQESLSPVRDAPEQGEAGECCRDFVVDGPLCP